MNLFKIFTTIYTTLIFCHLSRLTAGQEREETSCFACDSVQMPECSDPFNHTDSVYHCDYTEPVGQIGRALGAPESSYSNIKQELQSNFPSRFLPQPSRIDVAPGKCAKFIISKEGHPAIVIRGCSRHGNKTCDYVKQATELFKGTLDECHICEGNLCNTATSIPFSVLLLATSAFLGFLRF